MFLLSPSLTVTLISAASSDLLIFTPSSSLLSDSRYSLPSTFKTGIGYLSCTAMLTTAVPYESITAFPDIPSPEYLNSSGDERSLSVSETSK